MEECPNTGEVLAGTQVIVFAVTTPIQCALTGFLLFQLFQPHITKEMVHISCIGYFLSITIYGIVNTVHYTIARYYEWPLHHPIYCRIFVPITWLIGFSYVLNMELFWFLRLDLTFKNSIFALSTLHFRIFSFILLLLIIFYLILTGLISTSPLCAVHLTTIDFNPFGSDITSYTCGGWKSIYELIYMGLGAFIVVVLNVYLTAEYIIRLNRLRQEAADEGLDMWQIERHCIIALTSVFSTLITMVFAAAFPDSGYLGIPIDCIINGICMMCAFQFGNKLFSSLFGSCAQFFHKAQRKTLRLTNETNRSQTSSKSSVKNTSYKYDQNFFASYLNSPRVTKSLEPTNSNLAASELTASGKTSPQISMDHKDLAEFEKEQSPHGKTVEYIAVITPPRHRSTET